MNLTPKAALKTPALQPLPLAPWDKRRGVWAARRAGYPTGRVPDALLRREAFGVRASLAPLFSRCSPKGRFRGLRREPLREILPMNPPKDLGRTKMGKRRKKHLCPPQIFGFFPFPV